MSKFISLAEGVKYSSTSRKFEVDNLLLNRLFTNTEYFKRHPKNRHIDIQHVKSIAKAYLAGSYVPPIEVNVQTSYVDEGNHRLEAYRMAQKTGYDKPIEVHFIDIKPEEELKYMITRNTNTKGWSLNDYVYAFREEGNAYDKIISICESDEFGLLHKINPKTGKMTIKPRYFGDMCFGKQPDFYIKSGDLDKYLTPYYLEKGIAVYKEIEKILEKLQLPYNTQGGTLEALIIGWMNAKDAVSNDHHNWLKYLDNKYDTAIECMSKETVDTSACTNYAEWRDRFICHIGNIIRTKKIA